MKPKVLVVVGTRPEAIKMAPVIFALSESSLIDSLTVSTGQHKEMLDSAFEVFGLKPDKHLSLMTEGQSLAELASRAIMLLSEVIEDIRPELVLVHGDTTSAYAAAVAAFLCGVPVAHVEAGLRTRNMQAPFPEEFNRQSIARIATLNFAPTQAAARNLLSEGISLQGLVTTGNTVVDSVVWLENKFLSDPAWSSSCTRKIRDTIFPEFKQAPFALVTMHRRENRGESFNNILGEIRTQALENPDFHFVFPVHPNPIIRDVAHVFFEGLNNVHLTEPLDYLTFMYLFAHSEFAFSDSGGVQEEAATLDKMALVAREVTERPEGIKSGHLRLVGSHVELIRSSLAELISRGRLEEKSIVNLTLNPYGDGLASNRIVSAILAHFGMGDRQEDFHG